MTNQNQSNNRIAQPNQAKVETTVKAPASPPPLSMQTSPPPVPQNKALTLSHGLAPEAPSNVHITNARNLDIKTSRNTGSK